MKPSSRFYRCCYRIARPAIGIFYRLKIIGKENIPEGAAMVCANHSGMVDPFLIAFAFGIKCQVHVVTKAEVYKIPIISQIMKKLGMIRVDRGTLDTSTIKNMLGYLKNNEKVVIFPEGTRMSQDDAASAKTGAVKVADHAGVPLLPLFLPRKKPLFRRIPVVIGEPYRIEKQSRKRSVDEYTQLSEELMSKIKQLNPDNHMHEVRK